MKVVSDSASKFYDRLTRLIVGSSLKHCEFTGYLTSLGLFDDKCLFYMVHISATFNYSIINSIRHWSINL